MNIQAELEALITVALTAELGSPVPVPAIVRPTRNPVFGDYQATGVIRAAKSRGLDGAELAGRVLKRIEKKENTP